VADDLEGQAGQEGQQEEGAQQPAIDLNAALARVAEEYGMPSPDYVQDALRLQDENRRVFEENRRRDQELRKREQEIEARRRPEPLPEDIQNDPYRRDLYEMKSTLNELVTRQREREEYEQLVGQLGSETNSAYQSIARQNGLTKEQIESSAEGFYDALTELYPEPGMIQAMGVQRAAQNAWRVFRGQSGNNGTPYQPTRTGPRAQIVIPAGPTSSPAPAGIDTSPRKPGETIEQYSQRIENAGRMLQRQLQESGPVSLPDRYSSG